MPEQDARIMEIFEYIENLEDMSNGPESLPAIACGEIRTRLFKIEEWINSRNAEIEALKAEIEEMKCCGNCRFQIKGNYENPCYGCNRGQHGDKDIWTRTK